MSLRKAHRTIDAVQRLIPNSLIFILDTIDRSFIYCSEKEHSCMDVILSLDKTKGFDNMSSESGNCVYEEHGRLLHLRKLSNNTFLGFCVQKDQNSIESIEKAAAML